MKLTEDLASRFTRIALGHVTREYPHKLDHVLAGDEDALPPHVLHPIFFGSFDWHSCVHGYWTLARLLRRFPARPECAYLARPGARGFERPYGWAWLLMLAAELKRFEDADGRRWSATLQPLADAFVARFKAFLPLAAYPIRTGVHSSTAFAAALALEYADVARDAALRTQLVDCARHWYTRDADCQAWEPSLDDFLSPALMEGEAMRSALPPAEFAAWFSAFLPRLAQREPAALFAPARATDRTDGKIAHLDGLNLSRAWCWRSLAPTLDAPLRAIALEAADAHLAAALPHVAGDYMGEHWLASFALLALEA